MGAVVRWENPPENPKSGSKYDDVLAELQAHPDMWALVAEGAASNSATVVLRRKGCNVRTVKRTGANGKWEYDTYASWPPDKEP